MVDIYNFNNVSDYLPILNSVIITDIFVIILLIKGLIKSTVLENWYRNLTLSAVIADVLIIVIGIILTRFLYPYIFSKYNLINFLILAVLIQITHDILFYLFCKSVKKGKSEILDIFKDCICFKNFSAGLYFFISISKFIIFLKAIKNLLFNLNAFLYNLKAIKYFFCFKNTLPRLL